ncbi:MAG: nucleoside kinase [Candidatus Marinimicrobia bacterium]|nr:nucleoside kinase [Candidatus Neomarinimicrobiota bacterium]
MMTIFDLSARQATLTFLLSAAFRQVFPGSKLIVEHSFTDGYFCHRDDWSPITQQDADGLELVMRQWLADTTPIESVLLSKNDILKIFTHKQLVNKTAMIRRWPSEDVPMIRFGDIVDYQMEPMCLDKSQLSQFQLMPYDHGMLIRFPSILNPDRVMPFHDYPQLFEFIEEYEQWGSILHIESIAQLNDHVDTGTIRELVWVAEGLHEKKIAKIADSIGENFPKKRIVFVAGPSASGKTTFAKRLSIQLRVNGFTTRHISMDDYFIDRDDIPVDEHGNQDFESFEVLNNVLLTDRLGALLKGNAIPERRFDFVSGTGQDTHKTIQLSEKDIVIVEGIHGLNPRLTQSLGVNQVSKIYVSAMTQLNVDGDHRFSTSDNRLLRRIVRDFKFRHYTPEDTFARWNSIRQGEVTHIFPYQEEADYFFNSALIYELPVLAKIVLPLLNDVDEKFHLIEQVNRVKLLLSFFLPLDENVVPGISLLREFIGKSEFDYS